MFCAEGVSCAQAVAAPRLHIAGSIKATVQTNFRAGECTFFLIVCSIFLVCGLKQRAVLQIARLLGSVCSRIYRARSPRPFRLCWSGLLMLVPSAGPVRWSNPLL